MNEPTPHYINENKSDLRGVKQGWYAMDDNGTLVYGPFLSCEACLVRIHAATSIVV
jgi:hypothetical protein